ncbi:MAG TPA: hypothetical protein V6D26_31600 [Stenomitos sp.]
MSRSDEKPSKRPLIIAITSLALAFFALGVAVSLSVPTLRKSSSLSPTTPVVPFAPSRTQASPTSAPASKPKTVRSPQAAGQTVRSPKTEHEVSSPAPTSATSTSATPDNNTNNLNEDKN